MSETHATIVECAAGGRARAIVFAIAAVTPPHGKRASRELEQQR